MYDEIDEKKEKRNSIILTIMIVITILLIVVTAVFFIITKMNDDSTEKNAQDKFKEFNEKKLNLANERNGLDNKADPISIGGTTSDITKGRSSRIKMENYDVVGTIRIPKTKVQYPILFPLSKRSLEIATAMLDTQNGINEPGNTTILGHNYRSNMFFSKNHTLKVGDKIYIKDNTGREVEYTIYKGFSTTPNDATYMRRDTKGETEV